MTYQIIISQQLKSYIIGTVIGLAIILLVELIIAIIKSRR